MPFGRYTVIGEDGNPVGTEEFRSAPGPLGWRYFSQVETTEPSPHSETIDFAVDADWRIARVRIATEEHEILLQASSDGAALAGYRDNQPIEIADGRNLHLDYLTPATIITTTGSVTAASSVPSATAPDTGFTSRLY